MRVFLVFVVLAFAGRAFSAACCGGAVSAPTLITGDDKGQISTSLILSRVIGDVPASGDAIFRTSRQKEQMATLRAEGAFLISDRWQAGLSVPYSTRSHSGDAGTGFADVSGNITYEVLPEYTYSLLRPHLFIYSQLTVPTGQSTYDSASGNYTDAFGRGFYSLSAGALALKTWGNWDASVLLEGHRSFTNHFDSPAGELEERPGWGSIVSVGAGYSLGDFRAGLSLAPNYEQGITEVLNGQTTQTSYQLVWNTSAQLSYLVAKDMSVAMIYTDQTLMGPAVNVALNRSLTVLFQKRWQR